MLVFNWSGRWQCGVVRVKESALNISDFDVVLPGTPT